MKDEERNKLEDVFFSKLHDIEVDTLPEDWEAIAGRLPVKAPVPFRRTLSYWVAAAVISLLVVTGSIFLYEKEAGSGPIAQEASPAMETIPDRQQPAPTSLLPEYRKIGKEEKTDVQIGAQAVAKPAPARVEVVSANGVPVASDVSAAPTPSTGIASASLLGTWGAGQAVSDPEKNEELPAVPGSGPMTLQMKEQTGERKEPGQKDLEQKEPEPEKKHSSVRLPESRSRSLLAEAAPVSKASSGASPRKWGIGMGAGGLSVGADHVIPQYVTNSSTLRSESLLMMNAVSFNDDELPKTDIHHKMPVSFGLSISRYLNNRFSLQTGLSYSFLSSDWKTNGDYHGKTKQKLHFIGIPLSLTYKIAEWNRFHFYASAGGMTEVNVAGKRRTQLFSDTKEINSMQERVRMKEWLWSVNARGGVSYPLIRFVSAFAEVGASYYFDNGSSVETIHSEKPFNVSLQLGFRLGF